MDENASSAKATLAAVRRSLIARLKEAGSENATAEADRILIRLLGCTRATILAHPERILTEADIAFVEEAARRRALGEPLQYILREEFFYGRSFEVGPGVLIPRPETELLAELALEHLPLSVPRTFLDWGTGSGCIAITLLLERPAAKAVMAEKNPRSVLRAWKNITRYGLHSRCLLHHSQTPEDIPVPRKSLDMIVSNPPYIPSEEIDGLMREVRDYEPRPALDGGPDGMDFYRLLFRFAPLWLKPEGILLLETGSAVQAEAVKNAELSRFTLLKEITDLNAIPRCLALGAEGP